MKFLIKKRMDLKHGGIPVLDKGGSDEEVEGIPFSLAQILESWLFPLLPPSHVFHCCNSLLSFRVSIFLVGISLVKVTADLHIAKSLDTELLLLLDLCLT